MLLFSSSFIVENISPKTDSHALAPSQKMENFQHHYDFEIDLKKKRYLKLWPSGQLLMFWDSTSIKTRQCPHRIENQSINS